MRAHLFNALGYNARDPEALAEARKISDKALADPSSVDHDLAGVALSLAALNGGPDFYDKVMNALKNTKSPEEYYEYFFTLAAVYRSQAAGANLAVRRFARCALAGCAATGDQRFGESRRGKSRLGFHSAALAGTGEGWRSFRQRQVVGATGVFCDAGMRDQVTDFFAAHKVAAAERTYKQSMERINNCVELKAAAGEQAGLMAGTARHRRRKVTVGDSLGFPGLFIARLAAPDATASPANNRSAASLRRNR